jgi:hypothetical protein
MGSWRPLQCFLICLVASGSCTLQATDPARPFAPDQAATPERQELQFGAFGEFVSEDVVDVHLRNLTNLGDVLEGQDA